jgi:DNA adenine methylase
MAPITRTPSVEGATFRYNSPLRYPGGKARLTGFFEGFIKTNRLTGGDYVEPYAGGAGLALGLLRRDVVSHIHLNDIDRSVYALWHTMLRKPDLLCARIDSFELTIEEWRKQHNAQKLKTTASLEDLGVSTFYLNRTNRSGIIRSGGPIGGTGQKGEWKLDARFNRDELKERIRRIAALRSRISIYNLDALVFMERIGKTIPQKSLFYLDPPYYVKGRRRLYANSYTRDDHELIADLLSLLPWPWAISYDPAPEILSLYRQHQKRLFTLEYSASNRCKGSEVMFFPPGLRIPPRWSPELKKSLLPAVA